jgi:amino acid adenylation domain-containing protein
MTSSISPGSDPKGAVNQVFVFPCSFAQRRLWFLHQLDPSSFAYNITAPQQISGPLDSAVLKRSLNEVVQRHESLRTTFRSVQGEPVQVIAPSQTLDLEIIDLSSRLAAEQEEETNRLAVREAQQAFDLVQGPLMRAILLRRSEHDHVLLLNMHHIISDGWSLSILMREVSIIYDAFSAGRPSPLPQLPIQYPDFSEWQRKWLEGGILQKQLDYWKRQLAGIPSSLDLPTDRPRTVESTSLGAQQLIHIDAGLFLALKQLGQQHGATSYMVLLAAFQVLLYRYTGQTDITVGSPIAGRTRAETEEIIGFFVNTLVMRTDLSGRPSFVELLARVKEVSLGAYSNQDIPFEKLIEVLSPARDLSRTPLFQVMFILQDLRSVGFQLGSAKLTTLDIHGGTSKFELTLALEESGDSIRGHISYKTALFEPETIGRMLGHYKELLANIARDPGQSISFLPLLTEKERDKLLHGWNGNEKIHPDTKCVHQLFEKHALSMPHAIAVAGEEGSRTYAEINCQANQLARYLQHLGIKPEVPVGIFLEPSIELLLGVLSTLKAGGSYVPIDPVFPKDRISYILEDSQVPVLLTRTSMRDRVDAPRIHIICLDAVENLISAFDSGNLPPTAMLENPVYTIYTSGSTGRPKGVVVEQRQILNYLYGIVERFDLRPGAQYSMLQPLAVDSSNTVFFPAICAGGTLHVMPRERAADPYAVLEYFQKHRIDVLKIAPSHLAALLEACPSSELLPHHVLALGGEGSHWHWMCNAVQPLAPPQSKIFIHYGPTETTVGMLTNLVRREAAQRGALVPLGRPIPNTKAYVLDSAMQPTPVGVPGEIYIGGNNVARGYLNRPDLTADRFVPDPFSSQPGARLYRSGDLARWLPEGEIEFLGRTDYQVKIRGFRIELGEVESALRQHEQVERAIALAREDGATGKQLVAYVTLKRSETGKRNGNGIGNAQLTLPGRLRDFLKQRLPDYMVPAAIVVLDEMPLGPQGKVDLRALPSPSAGPAQREGTIIKPRSLVEARLVEIWEEILQVTPIGITDDFFKLGGHSLLAVRMMTMIRNRFKQTVPLQKLFFNPTIAHIAGLLATSQDQSSSSPSILVPIQSKGSGQPFFCVHPIGGNILCYVELARALGHERPFYALQSPSASMEITTVEEMATLYLREIRQVQPEGPYFLGGWSMGGLVAFEIARQLEAQDEAVALLALFDTYPSGQSREVIEDHDTLPLLVRFAADMGRLMGIDISGLRERFLKMEKHEMEALLLQVMLDAGVLAKETSEKDLNEMFSIFARNSMAVTRYRLQPLKQRTILFHAANNEPPGNLVADWSRWMDGDFESYLIPTDHYGMLTQPNVSVVAEQLKHCFTDKEYSTTAGTAHGETI